MNAAIVGASGYSGEALVRLLSLHPKIEQLIVTSRSLAGKQVSDTMPALRHIVGDLKFSESDPVALAARTDVELFFLALPHGVAHTYAEPLYAAGKTIIDLSADFRLSSAKQYAQYYGQAHPAPDLLKSAPYVLPELIETNWQKSRLIACPGCYPTSIQLPLVPLLKAGLIRPEGIVINSYSGVSGAGRKVAENFLYCERNESLQGYSMPVHRHLPEIEMQLEKAAFADVVVQFNPHLAPINRGIASTIVAKAKQTTIDALYRCWENAYQASPFVSLLPTGLFPSTQAVAGSNRADIAAVYDERTDNFVITSCIDNLLKGASGQAVQIMNLKYGFDESCGLL